MIGNKAAYPLLALVCLAATKLSTRTRWPLRSSGWYPVDIVVFFVFDSHLFQPRIQPLNRRQKL